MEAKTKFCLQARDFALTYPRCDRTPAELLSFIRMKFGEKILYAAVVQEPHKDGFPHLHAHVQFKSIFKASERTFDLADFHPNVQKVKDTEDWSKYLSKNGTPESTGSMVILTRKKQKKQHSDEDPQEKRKQQNELILARDLPELVNSGEISIYSYVQLRNAKLAYQQDSLKVGAILDRQCYWIVGDPGIGKSYWVRSNFPSVFNKPQNKWWDGYVGEKEVLLDDLDCSVLGHYIKIWADNYSFKAEIKGSTITPCYTKFFVTSNYFPEQLFKDDLVMARAIERRFTLCTVERDETSSTLVNLFSKIKIDF